MTPTDIENRQRLIELRNTDQSFLQLKFQKAATSRVKKHNNSRQSPVKLSSKFDEKTDDDVDDVDDVDGGEPDGHVTTARLLRRFRTWKNVRRSAMKHTLPLALRVTHTPSYISHSLTQQHQHTHNTSNSLASLLHTFTLSTHLSLSNKRTLSQTQLHTDSLSRSISHTHSLSISPSVVQSLHHPRFASNQISQLCLSQVPLL